MLSVDSNGLATERRQQKIHTHCNELKAEVRGIVRIRKLNFV